MVRSSGGAARSDCILWSPTCGAYMCGKQAPCGRSSAHNTTSLAGLSLASFGSNTLASGVHRWVVAGLFPAGGTRPLFPQHRGWTTRPTACWSREEDAALAVGGSRNGSKERREGGRKRERGRREGERKMEGRKEGGRK